MKLTKAAVLAAVARDKTGGTAEALRERNGGLGTLEQWARHLERLSSERKIRREYRLTFGIPIAGINASFAVFLPNAKVSNSGPET